MLEKLNQLNLSLQGENKNIFTLKSKIEAFIKKLNIGISIKDISVFFSNSEKRLSLMHSQVNDKYPDSSHSPLKRNCSTKWIENYDAVFVFKEFVSSCDCRFS